MLIVGLGIGLSVNVSGDEALIPSWIKNTAGFWVEGKISDSEFITALQFLVEKGILVIPQKETAATSKQNDESQEQSYTEKNYSSPQIDKKYNGVEATEKIKELINSHNGMNKLQRLEQISKKVSESKFVFAVIYEGKWSMFYSEGNTGMGEEGIGTTLIPFDCSHNSNYMQVATLQKIDEYGLATIIIFKNGVAIGHEASDKPYAIFGIGTLCDTGFDVNNTYLETISLS